MSEILLTAAEARVIAALVEKSITTPQYYPMTANALMLAANQKTSRNPVMNLSEGDVGNALNRLEELKLADRDSFSSRAQKWRHQFSHQMMLKPASQAVLVTLLLRGPQTLAELRTNAASLNGPHDEDGVRAALDDLADRAYPLAAQLPRAPGQSAVRYGHALCGSEAFAAAAEAVVSAAPPPADRSERSAALEARVAALEARIGELEQALGIGRPAS